MDEDEVVVSSRLPGSSSRRSPMSQSLQQLQRFVREPERVRALFALAALLLAVGGCAGHQGARESGEDRLASNLDRWESRRPARYEYTFARICYCPHSWHVEPVVITVEGDSVTDVRSKKGAQITPRLRSDYRTIRGLFERLRTWRSRDPDSTRMEFHGRLGYPTDVFFDLSEETADDEVGFRIFELRSSEEVMTAVWSPPLPWRLSRPSQNRRPAGHGAATGANRPGR